MNTKRLIGLLISVVVVFFLILFLRRVGVSNQVIEKRGEELFAGEKMPVSVVQEGTFLDAVAARFLFSIDGRLYEMMLPGRTIKRIAGYTADEKELTVLKSFVPLRPVWSDDGKMLAIMPDNATVVITEYETGVKKARFELAEPIDVKGKIKLEFSETGKNVALSSEGKEGYRVDILDIATQKQVKRFDGCSFPGAVWVKASDAVVTDCGKKLTFADFNTEKIIEKVYDGAKYELLNYYDDVSVMVAKGEEVGVLSVTGAYTKLKSTDYEPFTKETLKDPSQLLVGKLKEKGFSEVIDDMVVASRNMFALFHTSKGIWAVDVKLTKDPVFLIEGTLPSIQP